MTIDFISGRRDTPPRYFIYGPPKVGKTTFAIEAMQDPIVVSGEAGDSEFDVKRYPFGKDRAHPISWTEVLDATRKLKSETGFRSIIFDGMSEIERLCAAHVCAAQTPKWKSLLDPGYGKGDHALLAEMRIFHKEVEDLWARGLGIFFVAHAKLAKVKPSDREEYTRYEPDLVSVVHAMFVGWVDAVLFARPEVETSKLDSKRVIGVSTGRRILHTEEAAGHIAGCRYGNVDALLELSGAEFRRQVEEGKSPEKMRAKVAKLVASVGPDTAKRVTDWLATPASNNLSALVRASGALRREAEQAASNDTAQASA